MGFQLSVNTTSGGNSSNQLLPVGDGARFALAKEAARAKYNALKAEGVTVISVNVVDGAGATVYQYPAS